MKVLVIGGKGREHAIAWKLSQSRHVNKIYCCPGNAGMAGISERINVSPDDFNALVDFVKYEWLDLIIVGSENLFSTDILTAFEREGCKVWGPNSTAVRVRSSRVFEKNLMKLQRVPSAEYAVFTSNLHAQDYIRLKGAPIEIKIDGRYEENGVFFASKIEEATEALRRILRDRVFGEAGRQVIVEEHLKGRKFTFVALTDSKTLVPFASLYIYRHMNDHNEGPATAGMGAFSPGHAVSGDLEKVIMEKVMKPLLQALSLDGTKYKGAISADLVLNNDEIRVTGFNCNFGEMELQTLMPRLETDFAEIVSAVIEERLAELHIDWKQGASVCAVIYSRDYPGKYNTAPVIKGLDEVRSNPDGVVFHENTSFRNSRIVSEGGRVLSVAAAGGDMKEARKTVYNVIEKINFEGMHCRKDIGNIQKEKT
jgi:phosphoribosylamine---glycine ligase